MLDIADLSVVPTIGEMVDNTVVRRSLEAIGKYALSPTTEKSLRVCVRCRHCVSGLKFLSDRTPESVTASVLHKLGSEANSPPRRNTVRAEIFGIPREVSSREAWRVRHKHIEKTTR